MRSVQVSVRVPRNIAELWSRLSRVETWQGMTETFVGWGRNYRCALEKGSTLELGSELSVKSPLGRRVIFWRVSSWSPPNDLELTSAGTKCSERFHLLLALRLSEIDDDLTEVKASLVLIFLNRFLELLSLLLPVRLFYAGRMERAVKRLRDSPV